MSWNWVNLVFLAVLSFICGLAVGWFFRPDDYDRFDPHP